MAVTLNEAEVRAIVEDAVLIARSTTPGNVCDEAVVQWAMKDKYIEGDGWRSLYFVSDSGVKLRLDPVDEPAQPTGHSK